MRAKVGIVSKESCTNSTTSANPTSQQTSVTRGLAALERKRETPCVVCCAMSWALSDITAADENGRCEELRMRGVVYKCLSAAAMMHERARDGA